MQEIKDIQEEKRVVLDSVASRMGNKTIELENISKSYGNRKLISDYSYIFLKNDRIGIIGPNGCGKTTLLKIINGIVRPDSGTIEIGQTIRIGYFSQENEYMDASMKVIDYVKEVGNMSLHLTERSRHHRCWSVFYLTEPCSGRKSRSFPEEKSGDCI